jgi:hypothetical protein
MAMKEINLSRNYKIVITLALSNLTEFHKGKPFTRMKRDDIRASLNSLRKPGDPSNRWIGTYNLDLLFITRFFKMCQTFPVA